MPAGFETGERGSEGIMLVRGGLRLTDEVRAAEARVGVIKELRTADLGRGRVVLGVFLSASVVGCRVETSSVLSCLTRFALGATEAGEGFAVDLRGDWRLESASLKPAFELVRLSVAPTGWKRPGAAQNAEGWLAMESIFLNSAI